MRTKRLFVALELPPSCTESLVNLNPDLDEVQWLSAEQMYLPLSLRWSVDSAEEDRLVEALKRVAVHPFFLPLQGIGAYGRPPSITVSVGVGKGHPSFFVLHRHIQDAALQAQLNADLKPFHPHVTLARATETPKARFQKFLKEHAETEFCFFKVTSFALYRVEESFDGATYEVERRFP